MKTIIVEGDFTVKSANQSVKIEVYTPNSSNIKYDFQKKYQDIFKLVLDDLTPNETYYIDLSGYTFKGKFEFKITGDFNTPKAPVTGSFTDTDFAPGYTVITNS